MNINARFVVVPDTAAATHSPIPCILNPENESQVDFLLGTDAQVELVAWVRPGKEVGEELILRNIRRSAKIENSVDNANKASLDVRCMVQGSLTLESAHAAFVREDGVDDNNLLFPALATEPASFGASIMFLRWTGTQWMVTHQRLPS